MANREPDKPTVPDADLRVYREKRDFARTAEPAGGGVEGSPSGRMYVVQKHAARQLHYDLRLEIDGVLKSWAVPRGPSLDPAQKPLAVHTEDHPIEYGSFEGIIPAGEYGGGTVMLWDRGEWEPIGDPHEGYARGDFKFRLHGEKLRGAWVLARMRGEGNESGKNWLLIKKKDDASRSLSSYNVLGELPFSVASGRTMEQIADDPRSVWADGREQTLTGPAGVRSLPGAAPLPDPSRLPGATASAIPATIRPQLCASADRAPEGDGWLHEIKLDGYRLLCRIDGDDVRLLTRNGHDWTARFPAVARAARRLPVDTIVLDGEVVVLNAEGIADFSSLQGAFRGKASAAFTYSVFDVPYALGHDLTESPLLARKAFLAELLETAPMVAPTIVLCEHFVGNGSIVYEHAARFGLEGIIAKRIDARYVSRRSGTWLKVKCRHRREYVVGGFTDRSDGSGGFGALLVGHHVPDGRLVYAGRVGSGFTDRVLEELAGALAARLRDTPPFSNPEADPDWRRVHWARPELVAEVEFTELTADGLLRHAVFKGLREDKDPKEVVREAAPVRREAAKAAPAVVVAPPAPSDAVVAGVRISHPERTVYPEARVTKGDVARYYEQVAEWILPYVAKRPLSLVRCPLGLAGEAFYQRHLLDGFPKSVRGYTAEEAKGIDGDPYLVVDDLEGLVSLAQMGVLEIHTWGCREDELEKPDHLVFDLDPGEGIVWEHIVAAAGFVRDVLADLGLRSFVKTSGGKGVHVVAPVTRRAGWEEIKLFSRAVAVEIVRLAPRNFVATMSKTMREHRILVDYLRNQRGATAVAPYSTRARPGAGVSTPLHWEELRAEDPPSTYTVKTVPSRLASQQADPWADFRTVRQSITKTMRKKLGLGN